jgi:hypothetical protein
LFDANLQLRRVYAQHFPGEEENAAGPPGMALAPLGKRGGKKREGVGKISIYP